MRAIRVVVADDHHIVRRGLRALLDKARGIKVVGEAADGPDAVAAVERHRPQVLILDLMMPGMNGLDVARHLRSRARDTRVVILSMYSHEGYVAEALRAGVAGYVLKGANPQTLVKAIREAVAGRRYLSPPLAAPVEEMGDPRAKPVPDEVLTSRERQVLSLLVAGANNDEIGARLGVTPRTAATHRTNLMRKLHLHSLAALVRYALDRGLIRPGDAPGAG